MGEQMAGECVSDDVGADIFWIDLGGDCEFFELFCESLSCRKRGGVIRGEEEGTIFSAFLGEKVLSEG